MEKQEFEKLLPCKIAVGDYDELEGKWHPNESRSKKVQKKLFELGFYWNTSYGKFKKPMNENKLFLFCSSDKILGYAQSERYFKMDCKKHKEIKWDVLLGLVPNKWQIPSPCKIYVPTPEISEKVQKVLFEMGYEWPPARKTIQLIDKKYLTIGFCVEKEITWDFKKDFDEFKAPEIKWQDVVGEKELKLQVSDLEVDWNGKYWKVNEKTQEVKMINDLIKKMYPATEDACLVEKWFGEILGCKAYSKQSVFLDELNYFDKADKILAKAKEWEAEEKAKQEK